MNIINIFRELNSLIEDEKELFIVTNNNNNINNDILIEKISINEDTLPYIIKQVKEGSVFETIVETINHTQEKLLSQFGEKGEEMEEFF
ncbi:MAG: hypothetical protein [Caudoviricetes sp.]|nr:MAG: hypothetical protein [Caudoviricetes sp.]